MCKRHISYPKIAQLRNVISNVCHMATYIVNDIIDEEMDVMCESNLEPKDVKKHISNKARQWFMDYLDKQAGLA